ncbi:hypothetical protein GCM10009753_48860 [Streptantibioticus ferralitis]
MSASTMRVVVQDGFGGPEVLRVQEVPRPEPLPTEVLVRVHAAGINPVDWKTRAGTGMAGVLGEPPFVLGWDVSGVVEAVGFGVTTLKAGDEVYGIRGSRARPAATASTSPLPPASSPASPPP